MTKSSGILVDDFPCGCIITNSARQLMFANRYIAEEFGWNTDDVAVQDFENLMTPASRLFCESYLYPLLLQTGKCEEIQMTFLTSKGVRIPVIANARQASGDRVVWSVFCAENRDRLYQELVVARNRLEEQTRQLKVLSTIDDLTGLMNRRAFNEAVKDMFSTAAQTGDPVSLMLLDIDDFKKINDTFGHSFGDDVLRMVGASLANTCRSTELVARFGGEEFIFAMRGSDVERVNIFAERVHKEIKEALRKIHPVTVSIGVASRFSRHGPLYIDLLAQADKALYKAKETGKNKTVVGGNVRLVESINAV